MTLEQQKAKELVEKFRATKVAGFGCGVGGGNPCIIEFNISKYYTKQCAIIAVDEILKNLYRDSINYYSGVEFWQQVKQEIINA